MKRRLMVITDYAIYMVHPESGSLKRRIVLAAVERVWLSELSDNFFAVIIPTEYDLLVASTRKSEIVTQLAEATKNSSEFELEVISSNRYAYHFDGRYTSFAVFSFPCKDVHSVVINELFR